MPDYTSLPGTGNTNNDLSSLSVEGFNLSPAFDEDVLTYNVYVPTSTEKVNIIATPNSSTSKIEGTGEIALEDNEVDITITVTSEAGTEKKYIISIRKIDDTIIPTEVIEAASLSSTSDIITKVQNGTKVLDFKNKLLSSGAREITITNKDGATLSDNDILSTSSKIKITTLIESKEFNISVKGDTSGDGEITILDLLQVQKHLLKDKILSNEAFESADTSGDGEVTILDLLQIQKHLLGDKKL